MIKINYVFADGHSEEVEVSEEVAEFLAVSYREEENLARKERYHQPTSLDDAKFEGEWFADNETPVFYLNIQEEHEHVSAFFNILTDNQREKLEYKIAHPEASLRDIANHFGVALSSIRDTFNYIKKKYLTFFELGTTQTA